MKTLQSLRLVAASVLALGVANAFAAGTDADNINLKAEIVTSCTIETADINFDDYDPIVANAATDVDRYAPIKTTCTIGSLPTLSITTGANNAAAGGEPVGRKLRKGASADYLNYTLYSDAAGGAAWVDGIAVTTPSGTEEFNDLFARLHQGQNKPVGTYNDTVTVTVTF